MQRRPYSSSGRNRSREDFRYSQVSFYKHEAQASESGNRRNPLARASCLYLLAIRKNGAVPLRREVSKAWTPKTLSQTAIFNRSPGRKLWALQVAGRTHFNPLTLQTARNRSSRDVRAHTLCGRSEANVGPRTGRDCVPTQSVGTRRLGRERSSSTPFSPRKMLLFL